MIRASEGGPTGIFRHLSAIEGGQGGGRPLLSLRGGHGPPAPTLDPPLNARATAHGISLLSEGANLVARVKTIET